MRPYYSIHRFRLRALRFDCSRGVKQRVRRLSAACPRWAFTVSPALSLRLALRAECRRAVRCDTCPHDVGAALSANRLRCCAALRARGLIGIASYVFVGPPLGRCLIASKAPAISLK